MSRRTHTHTQTRARAHTHTHLVQKQIVWNLPADGSNAWRLQEQRGGAVPVALTEHRHQNVPGCAKVSKETYCSVKRDLLRSEHRHKDVTSEEVRETF